LPPSISRNTGILATLATAFIWAWPMIFIRMLSYDFDIYTQSFYRYLSACVFFLIFSMIFMRHELVRAARNVKLLVVPSLLVAFFQMFNVAGVYMTNASVVGIANRINTLFIVLFSYLLFSEERRVIKSRYFIIANLFVITGIAGLTMGATELDLEFNMGVVMVLIGAVFWAAYIISLRRIVNTLEPLGAFPIIQFLAALVFLPIVLVSGDLLKVAEVSIQTNIILVVSGVICVGLGNITNYIAIKHLGSTIPASILTFKPILTILFAYIILGEVLTTFQLLSGLLLLVGCWIIVAKVVTRYTGTEMR